MMGGPGPDRNARRGASPLGVGPRPLWMVVLIALMFLFAGRLFLSGASTLQSLRTADPAVPAGVAGTGDEERLLRAVAELRSSVEREHPVPTALHAAAGVGVALLLFFVVAAVLARDPRGRRLAVVAALVTIGYHLGDALFTMTFIRESVVAAAPRLAEVIGGGDGAQGAGLPTAAEVERAADRFMLTIPAVTALFGIGWCALVLAYFGGKKGRAFYAEGAAPPDGR